MTTSPITVERLAGRIGAEISGVRLSGDLDQESVSIIREALNTHKVVFFRGQGHLDDTMQEDFAGLLGKVVGHPALPPLEGTRYVQTVDAEAGQFANTWHTDLPFVATPYAFNILRSLILPPFGGDTLFANTATAYEELSPSLQRLANDLWQSHTNAGGYSQKNVEESKKEYDSAAAEKNRAALTSVVYETEQPIVHLHPETGEPALLITVAETRPILGVSRPDSNLLQQLFQNHIIRPENTCRWHWTPGSVAIWDNRATQHYAPHDYDAPRLMHRVGVIVNEPFISVDGRQAVIRKGADAAWYQENKAEVTA